MKKQRIKNYLKLGILLFGILLTLNNCQNEGIEFREDKSNFLKGLSYQDFLNVKNSPIVRAKTNKFIYTDSPLNRTDTDPITFSIDTTAVQVIESEAYISYTFTAHMFNEVENQLSNYILTIYNNESVNQLLVTYPILTDGDTISYDMNNIIAEEIDGEVSYSRLPGCEGYYEVVSWDAYGGTCVDYDCTAGGNHSPGDSCSGNESEQAYTICTGAWVTSCVGGGNNGAGNPSNEDPSSGGGGSTGPTGGPASPIAVVPYDETFGLRRECQKIKYILDDPDNAVFKQKILEISNDENLNLNYEKSVGLFENQTNLDEHSGNPNQASTRILNDVANNYISIAHNHPDDANGTLSIFSFDDLVAFAKVLENDNLNANKFVAFLATKKGTKYALTIHNKTKFSNALFRFHTEFPSTVEEFTKYQAS